MTGYHDRVRTLVADEIGRRGWSDLQLASAAQVDAGTVTDFLSGARWPWRRTLARIDEALGWEAGTLEKVSRTGVVPDAIKPSDETWRMIRDVPDVELLAEVARRMSHTGRVESRPMPAFVSPLRPTVVPDEPVPVAADDRDPRESDEYDGDDPA